MYIDIQKFKNGQLYSRPEWNTDSKKESILCEGLNVYLLMSILDGKTWSVSKEDYVMNHGFLFDDYFEVNDPLHFYQEKQESKLKKAIEETRSKDIKDILTVPCGGVNEKSIFGNPYMQYGTGTPVSVTLDTGVNTPYLGIDFCKSVKEDCVISAFDEKLKPLQTINEYIKHKGIDKTQNKEFLEELVKLSQYYKGVKIEDDSI